MPGHFSSSEEEADDVYMIFLAQPPLAFSNNKEVFTVVPAEEPRLRDPHSPAWLGLL